MKIVKASLLPGLPVVLASCLLQKAGSLAPMGQTEGVWALTDPIEVAETVWETYHDTKIHWYVPRSLGAVENTIVASPENVRDNLMKGILPT